MDTTIVREAYGQIAEHFANHTLAFVDFAFALAPAGLLYRCITLLNTTGANFVRVSGLPAATAPTLVAADLLCAAASLELPYSAEAHPFSIIDALHRACAMTAEPLPFPVTAVSLDAIHEYEIPREEVPVHAALLQASDVACLRSVLRTRSHAVPSWSLLSTWKRTFIRHSERRAERIRLQQPRTRSRKRDRSILFVSNCSAYSGAEEAFYQLASRVDSYERFALIAHEGVLASRLRAAGVEVFCPEHDFSQPSVETGQLLDAILRQCSPDLLHINSYVGVPLLIAAYAHGIPAVQHVRVVDTGAYDEQLKYAYRILAVSEFVKREVCNRDVHPGKVTVVYDGIDIGHFRPGAVNKDVARQQLGIPAKAKVVLMVARYARNKRHDVFVRALAAVRQTVRNVHGVCVGEVWDGSGVYEQVQHDIAALGLRDAFSTYSFQQDIRILHAIADVVVLCSEREPLGLCILEAMAMGLPVIAPNSGGLSEIIRDGHDGLLVCTGDSEALADRLVRILNNEAYASRIAEAGRLLIETRFSIDTHRDLVQSIYDETLAHWHSKHASLTESAIV
ncbi:MAG TPA: glycosyltransferase family 4 protein [Bryobacteraceae bacterium]|nr:glycosyltransferase family 4 protein [Bryobacteraceae bacterium]